MPREMVHFQCCQHCKKKNVCTFIVALYVRTIFGDGVIELYIIETGASAQFAHANQDAPSTLVPPA